MGSDRELLELAAKAAGLKVQYSDNWGDYSIGEPYSKGEKRWNPLTDDGDALRLAVSIQLLVNVGDFMAYATDGEFKAEEMSDGQDIYEATRRCIVRAAAEIGRSL